MKKISCAYLIILLFSLHALYSPEADCDSHIQNITHEEKELRLVQKNNETLVSMKGYGMSGRPGDPAVPVKTLFVPLPEGEKPIGIEVKSIQWKTLPGSYRLACVQKPAVLMNPHPPLTQPNPAIYSSHEPFPSEPLKFVKEGKGFGKRFAQLSYSPVRWFPGTGIIQTIDEIEWELTTERLKDIQNPNTNITPSLPVLDSKDLFSRKSRSNEKDPANPRYVIITSAALESAFGPLAEWKTQKGIKAVIQTVEYINDNYPGIDSAEKIRNYIIECKNNWEIDYVLLGGDTDHVPARTAWAMDCEAGFYPDENEIRADLYFADLDGNWDADGDEIYGEIEDDVDLIPDLFIGRAPAGDADEAEALTEKWINYEKSPSPDYVYDVLFAAEILWNNPYTDSGIFKNMIDDDSMPDRYDPVTKLYESLGNESDTAVIAAMNDGQHFVDHAGHANYSIICTGNGSISRSEADALTNYSQQFIIYSIGCWASAFDKECIAESFINNDTGGAVAFIGNSRYGWGSQGNPGWGYSSQIDRKFFDILMSENMFELGKNLTAAKMFYVPLSHEENVWRWHQYQLNLLGDPEMPVWTRLPADLTVDFPPVITTGPFDFPLTVLSSGSPLKNARVCLFSEEENIYKVKNTDAAGRAYFSGTASNPCSITITAWAPNHIPCEGSLIVSDSGAYVGPVGHTIDDDNTGSSAGNNDQIIEPGETFELLLNVKNFGSSAVSDVAAEFSSSAPELTVLQNISSFGALSPGEEKQCVTPFVIAVSDSAAPNQSCSASINISFTQKSDKQKILHSYPLYVAGYELSLESYVIYDLQPLGDEDAAAEPGETFELSLVLHNSGDGWAYSPSGMLTSGNPHVNIISDTAAFYDIPPDASFGSQLFFEAALEGSLPGGEFPAFQLTVNAQGAQADQILDFVIAAGNTGFHDDMENGENNWNHGGDNDNWHLSDYRCHSENYSWYEGSEIYHNYMPEMDAWLETIPFTLAPDSSLTFQRWFNFPMYGSDGCFIEIYHGSQWTALDYLASGGALGLLDLNSDWNSHEIDLADFSGQVKIRFRFVSDYYDNLEGIYIDDVHIHGYTGSPWGSEPLPPSYTPTVLPSSTPTVPTQTFTMTPTCTIPPSHTPSQTPTAQKPIPACNPFGIFLIVILLSSALMKCRKSLRPHTSNSPINN